MKLQPHPASPSSPVETIEVIAARLRAGKLSLVFAVTGDIDKVRLPIAPGGGDRKDGLWKHSCFEAFIRRPGHRPYVELNFAPSGDWAAYAFDDYRAGMADAEVSAPIIRGDRHQDNYGLVASADLSGVGALDDGSTWALGLSAVIEAEDGSRSYWALAHPQEAPDFHHPHCFVLELPPADEA